MMEVHWKLLSDAKFCSLIGIFGISTQNNSHNNHTKVMGKEHTTKEQAKPPWNNFNQAN